MQKWMSIYRRASAFSDDTNKVTYMSDLSEKLYSSVKYTPGSYAFKIESVFLPLEQYQV